MKNSFLNALRISLFCMILVGVRLSGFGQTTESSKLYIEKTEVSEKSVAITYELNYPGFVEIHLTNPEGRKVWIHGKVADKAGLHTINMSRTPMEEGKRYSFVLKYKGKDYSGSFYNEVKEKKDS